MIAVQIKTKQRLVILRNRFAAKKKKQHKKRTKNKLIRKR